MKRRRLDTLRVLIRDLTKIQFRPRLFGGKWKPLSKLFCVCLPLEKLINEKHFPVKAKFGLVS
jgi:hypothetical protein